MPSLVAALMLVGCAPDAFRSSAAAAAAAASGGAGQTNKGKWVTLPALVTTMPALVIDGEE